jgi:hypothetical protein
MPYAQTIKIGSSQVVVGFEPPSFDPMESADALAPHLAASQEVIDQNAIKSKLEANHTALNDLWVVWKTQTKGTAEWLQSEADWQALNIENAKLQQQAKTQGDLVEQKRRALLEEYGVRFTIPGVEEIDAATETDLIAKLKTITAGNKLLLDGSIVIDNTGQKYWLQDGAQQWSEHVIDELGDTLPGGAVLERDLTNTQWDEIIDQKDLARIATLTPEQKDAEKTEMLAQALAEATQKKIEFEIQGHEDPLLATQQWYAAREAEIEARYS